MNGAAYEHNGRHVTREAFYTVACDPRRSVAVEACAGAGKTWMLVSRILRALLEEGDSACEPHEILAITFTKKAAGEMRERLDQWLEQFADQRARRIGEAAGDARRGTRCRARRRAATEGPLQAPARRRPAGAVPHLPRLVRRPAAQRAARGLRELGLPSNYELLEDDAEARGHTWRPFFEAVTADKHALADYYAVVATHGRSQTAKALGEALTKRVEFSLADAKTPSTARVPRSKGCSPRADPADARRQVRRRWLRPRRRLGREQQDAAARPTFSAIIARVRRQASPRESLSACSMRC
jgi:ATP-dependent helicase/nuclease subunit A